MGGRGSKAAPNNLQSFDHSISVIRGSELQSVKLRLLQVANVEIKRVIKGSDVLLGDRQSAFNGVGRRPRVLVAGIGDRAICNSEARNHDTRIFLVSRSGDGQLRLNSSLVRISLNNIERTEAAVNGLLMLTLSSTQPYDAHCCHMGTTVMHPVPDRVKPSFVIFDIRAL